MPTKQVFHPFSRRKKTPGSFPPPSMFQIFLVLISSENLLTFYDSVINFSTTPRFYAFIIFESLLCVFSSNSKFDMTALQSSNTHPESVSSRGKPFCS